MITDYQSLKAEIQRELKRNDLVNDIPGFIQRAELAINRRLKVAAMETMDNVPQVDGQQEYTLPTGLIELRDIHLASVPLKKLAYRTPQQLIIEYGYITGGRKIEAYTLINNAVKLNAPSVVPVGDPPADIILSYWKSFTPLSDTNTTNWLITDASDLIFYGSLIAGERFMARDDRIMVWKSVYADTMAEINRTEDRKRHTGDAMQMRAETQGNFRQAIQRR